MAEHSIGENVKTVIKNPLLSGAGAAFPFESFTNLSLLAPIEKEIPPNLVEGSLDVSEVDTFVGQETPASSPERPPIETANESGYSGLFRSFFGITPTEARDPLSNKSPLTADNQSSVDSTPRSYSPFVHVPSVVSYSPGLLVPREKEHQESNLESVADSHVDLTASAVVASATATEVVSPSPPPVALFGFQQVNDGRKEAAASFFEETAGSTCSSNDSIVADLQSRFPDASKINNNNTTTTRLPPFFQLQPQPEPEPEPQLQQQQHHHQPHVDDQIQFNKNPALQSVSFYEPPSFPSAPTTTTTTVVVPPNSSKYRLGNQRRPVYAPVPGLSAGPSQNQTPPSFFTPISQPADNFMAGTPPTTTTTTAMASEPVYSDTLNTVELKPRRSPSPSVSQRLANLGQSGIIYRPPYYHWFWNKDADDKDNWQPFSMTDSLELEEAFNSPTLSETTIVGADGGRYDIHLFTRRRQSVYWEERPGVVRRCSWFQRKSTEGRLRPYDENTALRLEEEYKTCVTSAAWNRHVQISDSEYVVFYGPTAMAHFFKDDWDPSDVLAESQKRGGVVKRGVEDFEIDDGESPIVDHLVFIVHGIGPFCDLKFRSIQEAVSDFRLKAQQLIKTHYRTSVDHGQVNRVEMIPVSWHQNLHQESGVDEKMKKITLKSIPKLRDFTNDTLLDILFYTSPVFCQNIMQQVGDQLNQLYRLFIKRNPAFHGHVSLCGHSLGSLILFDLLCHQKRDRTPDPFSITDRSLQRTGSYVTGSAGAGQPLVTYPQLNFQPNTLFAFGSPIGMFVTVRGIDSLGIDFRLPTCPGFYNLFHPFDPVAYRIEALINPQLCDLRPVLIPHHKGRKRMHLELREQMARVGADIKQRLIDSVKSTWNTVYQLAMFSRTDNAFEEEVNHAIASHLEARARTESVCEDDGPSAGTSLNLGVINQGRRVDYVLQEAPLESFNEYVSAITSHVCYWDSEDTILFVLKDIYTNLGIAADNPASIAAATANQDPPASPLVDDLPSVSQSTISPLNPTAIGVDPTMPINMSNPLQPPPTFGFTRK